MNIIKSHFDYDYLMLWFYDNREQLLIQCEGKQLLIDEKGVRRAFEDRFDAFSWANEIGLIPGKYIVQETNPEVFPLAPFIYHPTNAY